MNPEAPSPNADNRPLVSAILPVYNGERYLAATLESLLGQTYPSIEVVAVDDGSTDRSTAILEEYRDRFGGRLLVLTVPNGGVSRARNLGVERAKGAYVAFIDQDDLWLPAKVERQVEALARSGSRISFTNTAIIDGEGRTQSPRVDRFPGGDTVNWFEKVLFDPLVAISSVMVERALFLEIGGFSPELRISEDYDLLLRILWREKPAVVDEPLLEYRVHRGSNTFLTPDSLLREGVMIIGRWKAAHPEIFRRNRLEYAIFRLRVAFMRVKSIL
ncbi:MAG TPA: glycosyltransferase [Methanomicrobiales archaeon]|nr:glycosyltransferase [Methanomicrobiales archaeon]